MKKVTEVGYIVCVPEMDYYGPGFWVAAEHLEATKVLLSLIWTPQEIEIFTVAEFAAKPGTPANAFELWCGSGDNRAWCSLQEAAVRKLSGNPSASVYVGRFFDILRHTVYGDNHPPMWMIGREGYEYPHGRHDQRLPCVAK